MKKKKKKKILNFRIYRKGPSDKWIMPLKLDVKKQRIKIKKELKQNNEK